MSAPVDFTRTEYPAAEQSRIVLALISILAGALGWWASLRLLLDSMASLKDGDFIASCNLSAVVSCTQNIESSYGSLFGFSNTVIGLTLFTIPVVLGVLIFGGIKLPRWVYGGYSLGLLGAIVLISYLQFASFLDLKTLCLYCLLIWAVTIPLFWASLSVSLSPSEEARAHRVASRGILGIVSGNWWLFALVHFSAVLVFGELSIGAVSGLIGALFG